MTKRYILSIAIITVLIGLLASALSAQAFGRGPEHDRAAGWEPTWKFERMASYLELDEQQADQWLGVVEQHFTEASSHHDVLAELRRQFRQQAEMDEPDLYTLGRIALEIHTEMEASRVEREQMKSDLESILTPDQLDRFEALRTAREFSAPGPRDSRRRGKLESTDG